MTTKLFVEGGGDAASLKGDCRQGFRQFLEKAGLGGSMPRIVACGSRENAYDDFCTAVRNGDACFLLVDSEAAVSGDCQTGDLTEWRPWLHLKTQQGDGWDRPAGSEDSQCHLMVQCMESWLVADQGVLRRYFGNEGFNEKSLPKGSVESVDKDRLFKGLKDATKRTKKGEYEKGRDSFKILGELNPETVATASPWARRFLTLLKSRMTAGC